MPNQDLIHITEHFRTITEKTAISIFSFFGKNNKHDADEKAVNVMREALKNLPYKSHIVIGEGEKDNAPMLYEGEILGEGIIELDLAVDPLECTTNFSKGLPNSMSIIGFSDKGTMAKVPGTYMEQWIAGPSVKSAFQPNAKLKDNIQMLSDYRRKKISDLIIVVQDRPRHHNLIAELREIGCGVSLIDSGSITTALDICMDYGHYDAMIGIYGAPEGLISALIACLTHSEMKAIIRPHEEKFRKQWEERGYDIDIVLDKQDLVKGNQMGISATCISTNLFMKGLTKKGDRFEGQTLTITPNGYGIHEFVIGH